MREYGRFHALSFALRDQKPSLFQEISENVEEIFFNEEALFGEDLQKALDSQAERAMKALDHLLNKSAYKKFMRFKEHMVEITKKVVHGTAAGEYAVVCHGDCWVNNFLFKYGNPETLNCPFDMCIFDCTDKQFRDNHYDEMMSEYHSSLANFLTELGSDPEELYPFHVFKEDPQKFLVFGLYMSIQILYILGSDHEEIPDIHNFSSKDDAFKQINYESKNNEKFNSRIREVISDFDKLDYDC
ncbi:hypothetical protein FQA39_LY08300 [Lamprigera yunnana]|nr:hypothetical protein FQA39_LY08300 [Lamprigera yunnana]